MNWKRFLSNIAGVAIACAGAHQATQPAGTPTDWGMLGIGVALCVGANVLGLFQPQPHKDA